MHSLFIAPASSEAWFNAQADILGNNGPALVMCISEDGNEPATYGWCAVSLSPGKEADVAALLAANPDKNVDWSQYDLSEDPTFPEGQLAHLGLKLIQPAP